MCSLLPLQLRLMHVVNIAGTGVMLQLLSLELVAEVQRWLHLRECVCCRVRGRRHQCVLLSAT